MPLAQTRRMLKASLSSSLIGGRLRWWGSATIVAAVIVAINNGIGSYGNDLFHHGVKGRTARTLNPQKVPLSSMRFGFTVIAHNVDNALQIGRHGVLGNIPGSGFPGRRHGLLTHHSLFANGTTVVKAGEFTKAMRVNGVSTGQILR